MRIALALTCALVAGCYASHGRDDDAGRRDARATDVPGSCLPPRTYTVAIRIEDPMPADCIETMGTDTTTLRIPPRVEDFASMCGPTATIEVTELGPCTWRLFYECPIPDSSSRLEGTISTASGEISGRFDLGLSTLVGHCAATMIFEPEP